MKTALLVAVSWVLLWTVLFALLPNWVFWPMLIATSIAFRLCVSRYFNIPEES